MIGMCGSVVCTADISDQGTLSESGQRQHGSVSRARKPRGAFDGNYLSFERRHHEPATPSMFDMS